MPADSDYYSILERIQVVINTLDLALDSAIAQVNIRKLPKKEETVDPPTQIVIVPEEKRPPKFKYIGFASTASGTGEPLKAITYTTSVVIISPNNNDQVSNLDVYLNWYQQIITALIPPLGIAGQRKQRLNPDKILPPQDINEGYDYLVLGVELEVIS